jgi:hypothetical protein
MARPNLDVCTEAIRVSAKVIQNKSYHFASELVCKAVSTAFTASNNFFIGTTIARGSVAVYVTPINLFVFIIMFSASGPHVTMIVSLHDWSARL